MEWKILKFFQNNGRLKKLFQWKKPKKDLVFFLLQTLGIKIKAGFTYPLLIIHMSFIYLDTTNFSPLKFCFKKVMFNILICM